MDRRHRLLVVLATTIAASCGASSAFSQDRPNFGRVRAGEFPPCLHLVSPRTYVAGELVLSKTPYVVWVAAHKEGQQYFQAAWRAYGPFSLAGGRRYLFRGGDMGPNPRPTSTEISPGLASLHFENVEPQRAWIIVNPPPPGCGDAAGDPGNAGRGAGSGDSSSVTMEPNTDRWGSDYKKLERTSSADVCRSACAADPMCDAFSYVRSVRDCYLKKGVPSAKQNGDIVSGVKNRGNVPAAGQVTLSMEMNTDRWGSDYKKLVGMSSAETCRSACAADPMCDAYSYVRSVRDCYLKQGVPGPAPNNDIVSGVKNRTGR